MHNLITHSLILFYMWKHLEKILIFFLSIDPMCPSIDRNKLKNSNSTIWFVRSIKNRETWISRIFLRQFYMVFLEQTSIIWTWLTKIDNKIEFHWCYSLKDQFNILKSKFKQHHNINISFYQIIVSTTM